jgi:hypothetical protein
MIFLALDTLLTRVNVVKLQTMATTIFTFLSDQFQHELKQRAETGTDRFEVVMSNYKKIFWTEFAALSPISTCAELNPKIEHLAAANRQNLQSWLECLQQTITTAKPGLQTFFDDLIDIYSTYIGGNITSASEKFDLLLTNNNLYDSAVDFAGHYPITFRGRTNPPPYTGCNPFIRILACIKSCKKVTIPSADYFYHIPFNRLHYIKNYRFSITGQPIIYLGASIPTVLFELRSDLSNFKNIELSAWGTKPGKRLKMYDISNFFYDLINLVIIPIFDDGVGITCNDTHVTPNITTFVTDFKKFVISQFCTFKKKDIDGQVFIEQYVLPQLLTQQIRNHKSIEYDGFIFPSTQYSDRVSALNNEIYYGLFKNNIALFTHYSTADAYDQNLISNFEVIPIDKTLSMTATDFITESEKIKPADASKVMIKVKLQGLKRYYEKMRLNSVILTEINSIQMQFVSMIEFLKKL